jgi:hypothetical protein
MRTLSEQFNLGASEFKGIELVGLIKSRHICPVSTIRWILLLVWQKVLEEGLMVSTYQGKSIITDA